MNKYFAEATGTFALVFAGTGAIITNDISNGAITHVGISLTFGLVVMAMIYAVGDVSGAHINPAVTIGFHLAGQLGPKKMLLYIASQCTGAILASVILLVLFPNHPTMGATLPSGSIMQTFILEVVLTFILMFVILNVSTEAMEKGIMPGLAVGGTVALEALFAGPISGASMNPARSLAPALVSGNFQYLWIYIVATVLGAVIAIPAFKFIRK